MRTRYLIILLLIVATLAVYWRTGDNGFVNYDDNRYVTANPHVLTGLALDNVRWAFTATAASNWHPLTWLSHMADCQLYGLNPRGHHLMSVLFHIANTVLLFLVLGRMTGALWRSAFVAALFALHPLHVESVAWVAERKDVLSTLFFMVTLLAYARYVERPGPARYLPVLCSFALGLMAKPMLVTLPFVLLLLDWWPLGRFSATGPGIPDRPDETAPLAQTGARSAAGRLVLEKVPLLLLSVASAIVTVYAQKSGEALASTEVVPLGLRISNALVAYAAYIGKMVWPGNLAIIYPLPAQVPSWEAAGAVLLLGGVSVIVFRRMRRSPFLLVGWLWFLGTLVPVIGLVQVGIQAMADRYTYIPFIGLFIMIAWGVPQLLEGWRHRRIALAAAAVVIVVLFSVATWRQTGYWKDSRALFTHAIDHTTGNYMAHLNLGTALAEQGNLAEAEKHYREALRINPNLAMAYFNLGNTLMAQGRSAESVGCYLEAVRIAPNYVNAHYNLGVAFSGLGMNREAVTAYAEALRIRPDFAKARTGLGIALAREGRFEEAASQFSEALRLNPADAEARKNLDLALTALRGLR